MVNAAANRGKEMRIQTTTDSLLELNNVTMRRKDFDFGIQFAELVSEQLNVDIDTYITERWENNDDLFYLFESRSSKNLKMADKEMEKLKKQWRKDNLVLKRKKGGEAKSRSAGRWVGSLKDPEEWLTNFVNFIVYSMPASGSGRVKKLLSQLLEDVFPDIDGELIMETIEPIIDEIRTLQLVEMSKEYEGVITKIIWECEPQIMGIVDVYDTPISNGSLNISILNEEVKRVKVGKDAKVPTIRDLLKMQIDNYFELSAKLRDEYGITSPEKVAQFLKKIGEMIPRVTVKRKEAVTKPKTKGMVDVKKVH